MASSQPWLELNISTFKIVQYPRIEYIELSNDRGADLKARLVIKLPDKAERKQLDKFLLAIHRVGGECKALQGAEEGTPPSPRGSDGNPSKSDAIDMF